MVRRLLEAQTCEPSAMQSGPSRPPIMAALAQQKPRELLTGAAQCAYGIKTCPYQTTHCFVPGIGNPHRGELARPMQPCQTGGVAPVGLDPVARPLWDQRGGDHHAFMPGRRQLPLDAVAARSRFVAKPELYSVSAELAHQTIQRPRRVGDPAMFPDLTAQTALGHRHDNA